MGSAIITSNENMTENDLKIVCGSHFSPTLFQTLKNPSTNFIPKDFFIQLITESSSSSSNSATSPISRATSSAYASSSLSPSSSSSQQPIPNLEKEVYNVFMEYCPTGEMDIKIFLKLCRDTKTLKKNVFTSGEADLIFHKYKLKYNSKKFINYYIFRIDILPVIAMKRQLSLLDYMKKLAKTQGPGVIANVQPMKLPLSYNSNDITDISPTMTARSSSMSSGGPPKESISLFAASDEQINAVIKLQNFHRKTQAKIDLAALREIESMTHQQVQHKVTPLELDPFINNTLSNIFLQNSPDITSNEMNLHSFLQFCHNYSLYLPRSCTNNDCKLIFETTLTIGKQNEQINQFILFDKRIQYLAFRDILLPLLANKRKETVNELIETIIERQQQSQPLGHSLTPATITTAVNTRVN